MSWHGGGDNPQVQSHPLLAQGGVWDLWPQSSTNKSDSDLPKGSGSLHDCRGEEVTQQELSGWAGILQESWPPAPQQLELNESVTCLFEGFLAAHPAETSSPSG